LYAWGWGGSYQTALGTTDSRSSPTQIGTANWKNATGILYRGAAIKEDDTLWAWGINSYGETTGDGTRSTLVSTPTQVGTDSWRAVATGSNFTVAIRSDNTLWAWGLNNIGQLGQGNTTSRSSPVQIGTSSWTSITVGKTFCLGIRSDGTLWAWGEGSHGVLGQNNTTSFSSPVQIGTQSWKQVRVGSDNAGSHVLAIRSDDTLWAWGNGTNGKLGQNNTTSFSSPVQIGTGTWKKIAAGGGTGVAIKSDNTLWAWGFNHVGQLGIGNRTSMSSPVQVGTDANWSDVTSTYYGTQALRSNSTLWAWGYNGFGELGLGDTAHRSSPVQVGTDTWVRLGVSGDPGQTAGVFALK
jgi:alpha-tubulin suppressor-like RCC1 family protein